MLPAIMLLHTDAPLHFHSNVSDIIIPPGEGIGYVDAGFHLSYKNQTFEDAFVNYGKIVMTRTLLTAYPSGGPSTSRSLPREMANQSTQSSRPMLDFTISTMIKSRVRARYQSLSTTISECHAIQMTLETLMLHTISTISNSRPLPIQSSLEKTIPRPSRFVFRSLNLNNN
jgi:hypothetical protein